MALDVHALMRDAKARNASDIHLKVGNPPIFRIDGHLVRLEGLEVLEEEAMKDILSSFATQGDIMKFQKVMELDHSFMLDDVARFRVNVCRDDGDTRIVMRLIPLTIMSIDSLSLPPVLSKLCYLQNGIVLVTGPTGSGKSTTLAALIDLINEKRPAHIVTVEDPLEFVHADKMGIVTQREIGHDTLSFANALRGALRQDPDVILIGEMRDTETVRTAMQSAETGHLVFSTLHTVDAIETLNRILDYFEPHEQIQVRKQLASVLRAIISQRIIPLAEGTGRIVAAEILMGTRTVRDYIDQGRGFKELLNLMEESKDQYGMQTFDQALYDHWKAKKISYDTAMLYATSSKDLKLRMQGMNIR